MYSFFILNISTFFFKRNSQLNHKKQLSLYVGLLNSRSENRECDKIRIY